MFCTDTPKIQAESASLGQKPGYPRMLSCNIDANPSPNTDPEKGQLYWTFEQPPNGPQRLTEDGRCLTTLIGSIVLHLVILSM